MATAPDMQHPPSGKSKKSKKNRSHSVPADHMMANNAAMGGAVGGTPAPVPTRQLEFNQAMADFKTMFPSMDRDVIETVLRANNGAVDATIDQLLTLTADIPDGPQAAQQPQLPQYSDTGNNNFSSPPVGMVPVTPVSRGSGMPGDQPPPYSPPAPNSPFSQDMRTRQLPRTPTQPVVLPTAPLSTPSPVTVPFNTATTTMASPHEAETREPIGLAPARSTTTTPLSRRIHPRWNPPLLGDLPADFLRVVSPGNRQRSRSQPMLSIKLQERMARNVQQQSSVDANDVEMQQMLEDERFALTLQNEEFMRELQHNPEFIAALDRDYNQALTATSSTPSTTHTPTTHATTLSHQATPHQGAASPVSPAEGGAAAAGGVSTDDVEFRNKLTHMGKTTRFKFAQMAKKFNYRKKRSSSKPQQETAPASSMMNLLDDYDENGDSALLGTRPEVEENFYSDSHKHKTSKSRHRRDQEEPIIFYQEDNEFALHPEI